MEIQSNKLILVYWNVRGLAQSIRLLLFSLKVQFEEILLQRTDTLSQRKVPMKQLISLQKMPYIIHENRCICEVSIILRYLCLRFNQKILYGINLQDQARINQTMNKYEEKKNIRMQMVFKFVKLCTENPLKVEQIRKLFLQKIVQNSQFISMFNKLNENNNHTFLGYPTVVDFLLYQSCFYMTNLFGHLQKQWNQIIGKNYNLLNYLKIQRQFLENFEKKQFYQKNKQQIQKYKIDKIFLPFPPLQKCQFDFRKVWIGPMKYLR